MLGELVLFGAETGPVKLVLMATLVRGESPSPPVSVCGGAIEVVVVGNTPPPMLLVVVFGAAAAGTALGVTFLSATSGIRIYISIIRIGSYCEIKKPHLLCG
jgi:hypothetical protein